MLDFLFFPKNFGKSSLIILPSIKLQSVKVIGHYFYNMLVQDRNLHFLVPLQIFYFDTLAIEPPPAAIVSILSIGF